MSQMPPPVAPPPPVGYSNVPGPQKTNGPAIGSLICGLLGCVPFVTSLAAIILGIVGLKKTKDPNVGGKGLAITGLILGILGLGVWGLFGGGIFALVKGTETQRAVARQFVTDLAAGNVDAAFAQTDGTSMTKEELEDLSATLKSWGPLNDTTIIGVSANPGKTQIGGSATFGSTPKSFEAVVVKGADGNWKVAGIHFQ